MSLSEAVEATSSSTATNSCDICGWAAAFCSMLAFGSFGVPIKSKVARSLDIDPLVFQTYKTSMCFITSWLILLYHDIDFTFTPWGIVSGLFWVPGGVATIFAVKNAGLAIAMGVLSSFIVLVSFTWGIFIFREHVHSVFGACMAVFCMMLGLMGMAYYSSPSKTVPNNNNTYQEVELDDDDDDVIEADDEEEANHSNRQNDDVDDEERGEEMIENISSRRGLTEGDDDSNNDDNEDGDEPTSNELDDEDDVAVLVVNDDDAATAASTLPSPTPSSPSSLQQQQEEPHMVLFGMKWKRRTLGILSATFTGVYGGSIMVPMKWAPDDAKGLEYLISFAIGASIVTFALWVVRYLYLCQQHNSFAAAYYDLPSFHIRKMWMYGGACGLMWSIGNFFSIIAVDYLGEGVGYSATQTAMLVSGLWGIFYFHEIQGAETITKWFLSALLTLLGIVLLSYEHHEQ